MERTYREESTAIRVGGTASRAAVGGTRAAVGARAGSGAVCIDGVRLTYDDEGSGPVLVCLHAIGHGAGDFAALGSRLGRGWRIIALDWPGHGRSDEDTVPASAARYTELLAGFLDTVVPGPLVLLGNSIGGAVAIRYAAQHPERVRALVLENPGGLDPADRLARVAIGMMVRFFRAGERRAWWFRPAFAAYYRTVLQRRAAAAQRARIVASAPEIAPLLHQAWRSFGEPAADIRSLAPLVRCPVLFAWAARDQTVQLRRCRPAIEKFPQAEVETFPAGHAPHLETPDAFAASVVRFLGHLSS